MVSAIPRTPTPVREPIPWVEKDPAYRHISRVEEGKSDNRGMVDKVLNTPITMTVGDILAMSRTARDELKRSLIRRKVPIPAKALAYIESMSDTETEYWKEYSKHYEVNNIINLEDLPTIGDVFTVISQDEDLRPGTIVVNDPVAHYLETLPEGEKPAVVLSATDSQSLRAIWPIINNVGPEECLLDGGSQIVSMAEEVANHLELSWDPDICIHMQSANKQIERTLGLARNVPFKLGKITVFLQVHIIKSAAYKVLLGRPFDALTQSEYVNSKDGGMRMTLQCPNTHKRETFATYARGEVPHSVKTHNPADFQ